ncbi:MAG: hypothetical protein ACREQ7_06660 [Candidatus Binatia bacterium]
MKAEAKKNWQPPQFVSREQCIKDTAEVLGKPDIPIRQTEDIFRITVLGMDWDLGMVVYEPEDPTHSHRCRRKKSRLLLASWGLRRLQGNRAAFEAPGEQIRFQSTRRHFPGQILFS